MRNCLSYALVQWWRFGGSVRVRKSLLALDHGVSWWHPFNLVPHFLHVSKAGVVTQYTPTLEQRHEWRQQGQWREWLRLWHFDGVVVYGDREWEALQNLK